MCLAGVGVDHEEMVQYARSFNLPAGSGAAPDRATFYGGGWHASGLWGGWRGGGGGHSRIEDFFQFTGH